MADPDEFEVRGIRFRLKPLRVDVADKLYSQLGAMVAPLAGAALKDLDLTNIGQNVADSIDRLQPFRDVFEKVCEVNYTEGTHSKERWMPVGKVRDEVFSRNHMLRLEWLRACFEIEFGDFLDEIGQHLRRLFTAMTQSHSDSQSGSPGESGDLPQTDE